MTLTAAPIEKEVVDAGTRSLHINLDLTGPLLNFVMSQTEAATGVGLETSIRSGVGAASTIEAGALSVSCKLIS